MGLNLSTARLFSTISRLLHLVRVKGIRRTVKAGFESYVFAYQQFSVSSRPLVPFPAEETDFHCRLATMNDLKRLEVFEPYRKRSEFREWITNGSFVFIALDGELPVAFNVASTAAFVQLPFSKIPLQAHQIWGVDLYTLPSYRRRHAARALVSYKYIFLAARGFQELLSFTRTDNKATAAMWANHPRREGHRLTYLRILFFSRTWLESATTGTER